MKKSELTVVE